MTDVIRLSDQEDGFNKRNEKPIKLTPQKGGFSEGELKRARKKLKKAGIPKPWRMTITNTETGEEVLFEL